jgi:hypothetical protein
MSTRSEQRWRANAEGCDYDVHGVEEYSAFDVSRTEDALANDSIPNDDEIEIVVTHIRRLARTASLEFALRVGAVIIHYFYGGDTETWRTRGPKTASFRRLAQHPDLPLSPGSLYRSVALFELCERLRAPSRWEHLGASHLRCVLGLPQNLQEKLLATANAQRWTVKTLHERVLLEKSLRASRGGRRPQPPVAKSLMSAKKRLEDSVVLMERLRVLSDDDLTRSLELIDEARHCLDGLSAKLRAIGDETADV